MTTAAPPRIVSKCPVCRIFPAPTRDPDWHLTTQSHKDNLRDPSAGPERRVRIGTRDERIDGGNR